MALLQGREVFALLTEEAAFQAEWDGLYQNCPWATVFQSRDFVTTWYQVYQSKFSPVLIVTQAGGRLSGLLALAMPLSQADLPAGRLVGAGHYDAEYQTWLAWPEAGNDFMPQALEMLRRVLPQHHLQLRFLPPATPLAWLRSVRRKGQPTVLQPYKRPLMKLGDPELSKLFRKPEFRNKLNRLKRLGEVHFEQIADAGHFKRVLPLLALQYDFRQGALFNKNQFRDDPLKVKLLEALFQLNLLHVTVLSVQQEILAAIVAVKSGDWVHLGGINVHAPGYANYSPGFVHFLLLGQQLFQQQVAVFDLTPGQDAYKERLATGHDQVFELMVSATLADFLRKKMRKKLHGLLVNLNCRPMSFNLSLQKRLYLLRHHLQVIRRQGWLRALINQARHMVPGGKNKCYVLRTWPEARQEAVLLQENNLSDLLDCDPKNQGPSRWEFLEQAMYRFGLGERSFTWTENGCLLACAWLKLPDNGRAANNLPEVPKEAFLLHGIYCHPSFRNQFQTFLMALVTRLSDLPNSLPVFACIPSSDLTWEQELTKAGFRRYQPGKIV
ncbi:MAG: GNAT family N-acetyltransferase [Adhaeribacter sp.]